MLPTFLNGHHDFHEEINCTVPQVLHPETDFKIILMFAGKC